MTTCKTICCDPPRPNVSCRTSCYLLALAPSVIKPNTTLHCQTLGFAPFPFLSCSAHLTIHDVSGVWPRIKHKLIRWGSCGHTNGRCLAGASHADCLAVAKEACGHDQTCVAVAVLEDPDNLGSPTTQFVMYVRVPMPATLSTAVHSCNKLVIRIIFTNCAYVGTRTRHAWMLR